MINAQGINGSFLEYKRRPLVRQDNDIYYGDLSDKYHVYMMIMNEKKDAVNATDSVPDKIMVQLLAKDTKTPEKQTIVTGLAEAFEMADAWLERYNR
ncbi:MAG: hypothetical protein IJW83_03670 [Clostridia bacterium]|nr:hypothetical protein [Clostridia bacterium]